jgi:acyl carrier protein
MINNDAIAQVRACLAAIKPELDVAAVMVDTPLLAERVITSFDVLDLILHLEEISGRPINRTQLVPGSFRDIATIAAVFLAAELNQ